MKIKTICTPVFALILSASLFSQSPGQKKILFDCTHAETAGNGDWCIAATNHSLAWNPNACVGCGSKSDPTQYPTPTQTAVTSSTAETYWEGALSYWAIDCVKQGYWVETLPPATGQITYGNSSNLQDLSNYNVFVVDEPNIVFNAAEKTAIMHFIQNGGSLFAISDHTGSDRNNDGWDSPAIWNDFLTNNGVANNAFGYKFILENFSGVSANLVTATTDSITHGPFGSVSEVQWSNGTCMTINPSQNASVEAHVWKNGMGQTDTAALCVTARLQCGKIASIGDSSPPDDGTGNPSVTLYTGYTGDAAGNHRPWLMNMMIWLAEGSNCSTGINKPGMELQANVYPNPVKNALTVQLPFAAQKTSVSITDVLGKEVMSVTASGSQISVNEINATPGIYFVKIIADGKTQVTKLIKE